MKDKIIPVLIVLAISLFCGFAVIANQFNTLTSPLNRIAGPSVCGDRNFEIEQNSNVYIPGEGTTLITAYCVDKATGEKQDVSNQVMAEITKLQIVVGVISSLVIFGLAMVFLNWSARRLNVSFAELFQPSARRK